MIVSPQRTTVIAAFAGSILWAMANYFSVAYAPKKTVEELAAAKQKAIVEAIFALIAGVIGGWYAAPAIVSYYHIMDVQVISFIGLLTGLVFWKVIPGVVLWAAGWVGRVTGGKS